MDSEALKIILSLQEENTLLKRAIDDAAVMLSRREKHLVLEYGMPVTSFLFQEIDSILLSFNKEKQNPSDEGNNAENGIQ